MDKLRTLTTNEASCFQNFLFLLFFTSQVGKGVNDYTKDEVEDDDDDHEKEQQVVNHSGCKQWLLNKMKENKVLKSVQCKSGHKVQTREIKFYSDI